MDPQRQSIPEAGAYRMVQIVLRDLEAAARILERIDTLTPDPERALHLVAIRQALGELRTVVAPAQPSDA